MADIIEFKPKNKDTKKNISEKTQIIEFPNFREYIDIYEKALNGKKDQKSITNAFYKINKIVTNLKEPYEKKQQIVRFIDYFIDIIDEDLLNIIQLSYKNEALIFLLYKTFKEDEIIEEGFDLLEDIDDDFRNTLEKIAFHICFNLKEQTMIEFASGDKNFETQILILRDGNEDLNRKAQFLLALFARSNYDEGIFLIHKLSRKKHIVSGIIINIEGIFGVNPKELRKSIPEKNVICQDFNISEILF